MSKIIGKITRSASLGHFILCKCAEWSRCAWVILHFDSVSKGWDCCVNVVANQYGFRLMLIWICRRVNLITQGQPWVNTASRETPIAHSYELTGRERYHANESTHRDGWRCHAQTSNYFPCSLIVKIVFSTQVFFCFDLEGVTVRFNVFTLLVLSDQQPETQR